MHAHICSDLKNLKNLHLIQIIIVIQGKIFERYFYSQHKITAQLMRFVFYTNNSLVTLDDSKKLENKRIECHVLQ